MAHARGAHLGNRDLSGGAWGHCHDRADRAESEAAAYWAFAAPETIAAMRLEPIADLVLKRSRARRCALARSAEKEI